MAVLGLYSLGSLACLRLSSPYRMFVLKYLLIGKDWRRTLLRALIVAVVAYILFSMVLIPTRNLTDAMSPTIRNGEFVWWSPLPYWFSEPRRGDVVVVQLAGASVVRIARIIAVEGERVRLHEGQIFIDEREMSEGQIRLPYEVFESGYESEPVGFEEFFVMGDNREMTLEQLFSEGSFGRLHRDRIVGRLLF